MLGERTPLIGYEVSHPGGTEACGTGTLRDAPRRGTERPGTNTRAAAGPSPCGDRGPQPGVGNTGTGSAVTS